MVERARVHADTLFLSPERIDRNMFHHLNKKQDPHCTEETGVIAK